MNRRQAHGRDPHLDSVIRSFREKYSETITRESVALSVGPRLSSIGPRLSALGPRLSSLGPRLSSISPRLSYVVDVITEKTGNNAKKISILDDMSNQVQAQT